VKHSRQAGERGYVLGAVMAFIAILLIGMGTAERSWRYVVRDMKEEELIFRGGQIADAIQRYQAKNGNAVPTSLEQLVEGRYLRQEYKDPMTKSGEWRLIHQGEAAGPAGIPGAAPGAAPRPGAPGGLSPTPSPRPTPTPRGSPGVRPGQVFGGLVGVASQSTETGLRLFNGRSKYNEWLFVAGQPRVVGAAPVGPGAPGAPGAVPPGGVRPAASPRPR
jgi:hypothetical protein